MNLTLTTEHYKDLIVKLWKPHSEGSIILREREFAEINTLCRINQPITRIILRRMNAWRKKGNLCQMSNYQRSQLIAAPERISISSSSRCRGTPLLRNRIYLSAPQFRYRKVFKILGISQKYLDIGNIPNRSKPPLDIFMIFKT